MKRFLMVVICWEKMIMMIIMTTIMFITLVKMTMMMMMTKHQAREPIKLIDRN